MLAAKSFAFRGFRRNWSPAVAELKGQVDLCGLVIAALLLQAFLQQSGLLQDNKVIPAVAKLLDDGYTVISADLFGQGEFLQNGDRPDEQQMWHQMDASKPWHRYSGYTYGYNHPMFVKQLVFQMG